MRLSHRFNVLHMRLRRTAKFIHLTACPLCRPCRSKSTELAMYCSKRETKAFTAGSQFEPTLTVFDQLANTKQYPLRTSGLRQGRVSAVAATDVQDEQTAVFKQIDQRIIARISINALLRSGRIFPRC